MSVMYWKQQLLIALSLILDHIIKKNVHLVITKEKVLIQQTFRWTSAEVLYLNISNTFSIDSETFNVKVHSPSGNDFPYKGPLYIVDLTSVILINLQKMRYILENILFFSFENLKGRHNLVQEMHLITF